MALGRNGAEGPAGSVGAGGGQATGVVWDPVWGVIGEWQLSKGKSPSLLQGKGRSMLKEVGVAMRTTASARHGDWERIPENALICVPSHTTSFIRGARKE